MKSIVCAAFFDLTLGAHAQNSLEQNLQKQVTALQATVTALQKQVTTLQNQTALIANNPALKIGPFVSVDLSHENGVIGPHIIFKGVNVHIVDGTGQSYVSGNVASWTR